MSQQTKMFREKWVKFTFISGVIAFALLFILTKSTFSMSGFETTSIDEKPTKKLFYNNEWIEKNRSNIQNNDDYWVIPGSFCKSTSSSSMDVISSSEVGLSNNHDSVASIICPIISSKVQSNIDKAPTTLGIKILFKNNLEREQTITCTLMETLFSSITSGFTKRTSITGLESKYVNWQSIPRTSENTSLNVQCNLPENVDLHSITAFYLERITYDFTRVDRRFQEFLNNSDDTQGVSYTIVDAELGTVHEAAFGDHDIDLIAMLASTSKVPSSMLLVAIDEDPSVNFSVSEEIGNYIPWEGVYGDRTTIQLLSNTSGIPGLESLEEYDLHLCQFQPFGTLEECGKLIYQNEVKGTLPAGSVYDYGGSQWQLAGFVAEQVTGKSWKQIVEHYLVEPCALEVFEFGNMWSSLGAWDGTPDSLRGQSNPNIEGGAISNMRDYAKILTAHLRGGWCGGNRILSIDGVEKLQTNRAEEFRRNYGMGWRISYSTDKTPYLYWDPGAFGAVAWIDTSRGIGGYMAIDDYDTSSSSAAINLLIFEVIPLIESVVDAARGKSS